MKRILLAFAAVILCMGFMAPQAEACRLFRGRPVLRAVRVVTWPVRRVVAPRRTPRLIQRTNCCPTVARPARTPATPKCVGGVCTP